MASHPLERKMGHRPPFGDGRRAARAPLLFRKSGISLLELLSVSALIVLMAGLGYSAISGLSGSVGRRGAANVVMNTLEHARIAALESGQIVYVGF
ncbi:MAG TPA: hypothetical protein VIS99_10095, partial [Terrimicrobiaceae bacterium]